MTKKIKLPDVEPPPPPIEYLKVVSYKHEENVENWYLIWVSKGTHTSECLCRVNVDTGTYPAGSLIAHVNGEPEDRFVNAVEVVSTSGPENVDDVLFRAESGGVVEAPSNQLTEIAEPVTGWNSITNAPPGGSGAAVPGPWQEYRDPETDQTIPPLELKIENGVHPRDPSMSLRQCPICDKWFQLDEVCDNGGCSSEPTVPYAGYTHLYETLVIAGYFGEQSIDAIGEFLTTEEVPDHLGEFPTYDQFVLVDATLE